MCHLNAYDNYKERFLKGNYELIAELTDSIIDKDKNQMQLRYLGRNYNVDLISGEITSEMVVPNETDKIVIWNYLVNARGSEPTGQWVAFLEFPDAQNHQQMFKGSVLDPIIKTFGTDAEAFSKAAKALGGEPVNMGDAGFIIRVFPKILIAVSLYLADDEFPANANVIFDASIIGQINSPNVYALSGEVARKLCGYK